MHSTKPSRASRWVFWTSALVALSPGCAKLEAPSTEGAAASGKAGSAQTAWGRDDALAPRAAEAEEGAAEAKAPRPGAKRYGVMGPSDNAPAPPAAQGVAPGQPVPRGDKGGDDASQGAAVAIDPNGRFATTYRPGGGHLAAFESAVARGLVPAADRDLVGDVGARYVPAMDAPKGKALAFRYDLERQKLGPTGGRFHVRLALRSTAEQAKARPHLSVHLVLDTSGSMRGEAIVRAREAAAALVDKLAPTDDFSLTTFSSDAKLVVPDGVVGARRAEIKKTISAIEEGGGTNISAGLERAYAEAHKKTIPADAVRVVLLLSDGHANAGITSKPELSKLALDAFQDGIQTSSFGLGSDYDGALMSAIAADGAGGYYYLRDGSQIAPALGTELDKRVDPVATAVELRMRLKPDVKLLKVYGSRRLTDVEAARVRAQEVAADKHGQQNDGIKRDRQHDAEGGMRFFMPAFARDDAYHLLLELEAPAGVEARDAASIELKYKDRVAKKNVADELRLPIVYAKSAAESAASVDASVMRSVQGFAAGDALALAARHIAGGNRAAAVALLTEREGILREAAKTLNEPLFLTDADRLARLRTHAAGGNKGLGEPLVLAMLLETASSAHLR